MFEHIENMKAKPEHIRRRYAFLVSFSITAVIFAGWIASYGLKSSPVLADKESNIKTPVSSLTASVVGAYNDIKNIVFGSNKTEYTSVIEVTGGKR